MTEYILADLGWSAQFARQLEADEPLAPARISAVNRSDLDVLTEAGPRTVLAADESGTYAVGDWVLTDGTQAIRRLERATLIQRRAAGEIAKPQLIAANVDTLGIVTSCNSDFNPARLERYLAMAAS
ncbi:MAG: GTPase RsgA, partial [Alphaproteobacteria bacterium]|nr:GTPase RsgA [Alphaproteobacteria bacterium]